MEFFSSFLLNTGHKSQRKLFICDTTESSKTEPLPPKHIFHRAICLLRQPWGHDKTSPAWRESPSSRRTGVFIWSGGPQDYWLSWAQTPQQPRRLTALPEGGMKREVGTSWDTIHALLDILTHRCICVYSPNVTLSMFGTDHFCFIFRFNWGWCLFKHLHNVFL